MTTLQDIRSSDWQLSTTSGKVAQGIQDVWQCIFTILTTQKGTDPTRPDFGCGIYDYIDKPVNYAVPNMKREILQSIATYERRVKIISILHEVKEAQVTFKITWSFGDSIGYNVISASSGNGSVTSGPFHFSDDFNFEFS
jgi:phage baseplate assembly protein W